MINISIPGYDDILIKNLILDYNGTLSKDGILIDGVKERLNNIASLGVNIYIITADTNKTVNKQCSDINASVIVVDKDNATNDKLSLVETLGSETSFAIGNGRNDNLMLKASKLSICVIGDEGAYGPNIAVSDIIVTNINDGLDLILQPNRLIATLRG